MPMFTKRMSLHQVAQFWADLEAGRIEPPPGWERVKTGNGCLCWTRPYSRAELHNIAGRPARLAPPKPVRDDLPPPADMGDGKWYPGAVLIADDRTRATLGGQCTGVWE